MGQSGSWEWNLSADNGSLVIALPGKEGGEEEMTGIYLHTYLRSLAPPPSVLIPNNMYFGWHIACGLRQLTYVGP